MAGTHPSPVRAQHPWICHGWSLMELRVRNLEISEVDMESLTSCLLANINTAALRKSWERKERTCCLSSTCTLRPLNVLFPLLKSGEWPTNTQGQGDSSAILFKNGSSGAALDWLPTTITLCDPCKSAPYFPSHPTAVHWVVHVVGNDRMRIWPST